MDQGLKGRSPALKDGEEWLNFGGNWLWPVAQNRWTMMGEREWPPPPPLVEAPWAGSAWKGEDNSRYCLLTRAFGPPVNVKVSRLIKLDSAGRLLTIRQRAERTSRSRVPITLWTLTQVDRPDQILMPVDEDTAFEAGYKPLLFDAPPEELLTRGPGALVYDVRPGREHKLGTDSTRGWIAARRGNWLLIQRFAPDNGDEAQPDEGCTVEMYAHADLGYAEIETLSAERAVRTGQALQHNVAIECWPVAPKLSTSELILEVRRRLGEDDADAASPEEPGIRVARFSERGGRRSLTAEPGAIVEAQLPGNPTTGYTWALAEPTSDGVLQAEGEPTFVSAAPDRPGAPGVTHYRFTALAPGRTTLRFVYRRSWETDEAPLYVATLKVSVP